MLATLNITQDPALVILYNLLYFNYEKDEGQQCYQNWTINGILEDTAPCASINT
jgi:hypothetical protein